MDTFLKFLPYLPIDILIVFAAAYFFSLLIRIWSSRGGEKPLSNRQSDLVNALATAYAQQRRLAAAGVALPQDLLQFTAALDDVKSQADDSTSYGQLCQRFVTNFEKLTGKPGEFTREELQQLVSTYRAVEALPLYEDQSSSDPEVALYKLFLAVQNLMRASTVADPKDNTDTLLAKQAAQKISDQLCALFGKGHFLDFDHGLMSNVRLEPARLTVPAVAAILVVVGFLFTSINDDKAALNELAPWLAMFWVYVAVTISAAVYQGFTVYSNIFNNQPITKTFDNIVNVTIYLSFLFVITRTTIIFILFFNVGLGAGGAQPTPTDCCSTLEKRVSSLEQRVGELEKLKPGTSGLAPLIERIATATETISKNKPLSADDLKSITDTLSAINTSIGALKDPALKGVTDKLDEIKDALGGLKPVPVEPIDPGDDGQFSQLLDMQRELAELIAAGNANVSVEDASLSLVITEAMRLSSSIAQLTNTLAATAGDTKTDAQKLLFEVLENFIKEVTTLTADYIRAKIESVKGPNATDTNWAVIETRDAVVYFEPGVTGVPSPMRTPLASLGDRARAHPDCIVLARGYTDRAGNEATNLRLSFDRIVNVIGAMRLDLTDRVIISPLGESGLNGGRPPRTDQSEKAAADKQRRVEIGLLCPKPGNKARVIDRAGGAPLSGKAAPAATRQ